MKVKLTPLNIISALGLVAAVLYLTNRKDGPQRLDISGILVGFSLLVAVIAFTSDLIFRKFIPSLAKLWIIEGVLIVFIIILILLINGSV